MIARPLHAILWMISHCFLISVLSAIIRYLSSDYHILQITFMHNAVALLIVIPFMFKNRVEAFYTTKLPYHILRALLGACSLAMYFYAFTVIPLTQARGIALAGPLVSTLFAMLFLKERPGWYRNTALVTGFGGAVLIIRPATDDFSYVSMLVVGALILWAIIDVIIKGLSKTESTRTQSFYLLFFMSLFTAPLAIYYWKTPTDIQDWMLFASTGIIFLLNVNVFYRAISLADVTAILPFDFMGMVFTIIIAFLVFDEKVAFMTLMGAVIIVVSSVYVAYRERKMAYKSRATIPLSEE